MMISNYTKRLFLKLLLVISISQLLRLLFFVFNYQKFAKFSFSEIISTFFYGQVFDNISIIYCCSIFLIFVLFPFPYRNKKHYQSFTDIGLIGGTFFIIASNIQDIIMFSITKKRTGFDSLLFIDKDFGNVFWKYFSNYWYAFLMIGFLIGLLYKLVNIINQKYFVENESWSMRRYGIQFLYFIFFLTALIIIGRGVNYRPIQAIDASRFVHPQLVSLALNTPMQMISTCQNTKQNVLCFLDEQLAEKNVSAIKNGSLDSPNKMNVCIIIMESMGKEYIGYYNPKNNFTPFLDSLIPHCLSYPSSYANGVFSKHGIVSVIGGIPALLNEPFMNSPYQTNEIQSLGHYLQDFGYECSFYHGGRNGTMNFDNFVKQSNFGHYYGKNEYVGNATDDDGSWGIKDEPYFQYWKRELDHKKVPFCSVIFTLSNHDPYQVPEEFKSRFKGGELPIYKTVQYADYALKRFFDEAKKSKWYDNTLFIITADHTSISNDPAYFTPWNKYAIPILFYHPGGKLKADTTKTIAQIDIMPTVLDMVRYNKNYFCIGSSIFAPGKGLAYHFSDNNFNVIQDSTFLIFSGHNVWFRQNIFNDKIPVDNSIETILLERLKSHLQVFSQRMHRNEYRMGE
jgi:phosphoglycerol transferase MdoB-like AlkP superfamily enzyme